MNTLHYAIIQDYNRTKFFNDVEGLSIEQIEQINNTTNEAYKNIYLEDYETMLNSKDNKGNTFYRIVENEVLKTLKKYNLSFSDFKCYEHLVSSVHDMLCILP